MKTLHIIAGLLLSAGVAFGQSTDVSKEMDIVFNSLKNQDYELLKPLLDENVKVSELPTGMNDIVLPQVLRQLPSPYKYEIVSVANEGTNIRVQTHFYDDLRTSDHDFLFNADRKLIEMNILKNAKASVQRIEPVSPENSSYPDRIVVPFSLYHGLILVKAQINGREGNFLLDSGAPVLILNQGRTAELEHAKSDIEAQGVNGAIEDIGSVKIATFDWNGLKLQNFSSLSMDFSHLEIFGKKIHGIIGYEVFQDYELAFDYEQKTVTLTRTDANGNPVIASVTGKQLLTTAPIIEMKQHIAVINMTIAGKTYRIGIDSGAAENLLHEKHLAELSPVAGRIRTDKLEGADKIKQRVKRTKIARAEIAGLRFEKLNTAFSSASVDQLNNGYGGTPIDGLLGYEVMKQYVTTINYKSKEVRFFAN